MFFSTCSSNSVDFDDDHVVDGDDDVGDTDDEQLHSVQLNESEYVA